MKFKYTSNPVFTTRSWAITYFHASQDNPKFYRECDNACTKYMYDLVGYDEEGNELPGYEEIEFDILDTFQLDGEEYAQIELKGNRYWSHFRTVV